jgi:alkylation response protein AidB-like acyl-CoA dehydrogenase
MAVVERELGRTTWALGGFVGRPSRILLACKGEQIGRYLEPCARGERSECFALSEPGAGSDARAIATHATHDGADWVLNGLKHFISGAEHADFAIVFAVTGTDQTPKGPRSRATAFLVDMGTPGFEVRRGPTSVSYRGYPNSELMFTDCRVPDGQILGEEGSGYEVADRWLKDSRVMVAANCVGKARRAFEVAASWAATREQFGRPIGRFQGVSFKIADMAAEIEAAELLAFRAAWRLDRGEMTDADAAMAKLVASEALGRVTDNAMQILGGMGLMEETGIERLWRDARLERIWEGTSEIQRHIIAREILRTLEG